MTEPKGTRRVYSADQLQRLRASCSQPKLREAIEQLDGEDAELVKGIIWRYAKPHCQQREMPARFHYPCEASFHSSPDGHLFGHMISIPEPRLYP